MLRLIAHGETNRRIAEALGLSAEAADGMREDLSRKLGIHRRTGLVVYAQKHALL